MGKGFFYDIGDRVWFHGALCEIISVFADENGYVFFELLRIQDDSTFLADARMFHSECSMSKSV